MFAQIFQLSCFFFKYSIDVSSWLRRAASLEGVLLECKKTLKFQVEEFLFTLQGLLRTATPDWRNYLLLLEPQKESRWSTVLLQEKMESWKPKSPFDAQKSHGTFQA